MPTVNSSTDQRALYESLLVGQGAAIERLYILLHQRTKGYILASGGSSNDVKTIVHESIIAFWFNLRSGKYEWRDEAELMTYLVAISRNKWREMHRQRSRQVALDLAENTGNLHQNATDEPDFERRRLAVEQGLVLLGEKCRRCLELFYLERQSMQQIATLFGWTSEDVAKNEKYRCLVRLRRLIGLSNWTDL